MEDIKAKLGEVSELKQQMTRIEADLKHKQQELMSKLDQANLKALNDDKGNEVQLVERTSFEPHYSDEQRDDIDTIKESLKTKRGEIEFELQKAGKEKEVVSRFLKISWNGTQ